MNNSTFLYCNPSVFVIENSYQILINTVDNGICWLEVNGKKYYEKNSGVLSTEKKNFIIVVPQTELNRHKSYDIVFRKAIDRKGYFSKIDPEERKNYVFKPLEKETDIHIYHIADVHYHYEVAEKACSYFGSDLDLLVVNGDIGEVESIENYVETAVFLGNISKGEVPVIFTRGNHDARGKLAEIFTDYFPTSNKKTYYKFTVGCISGVAFDCGEDKEDDYVYGPEYNCVRAYDGYNIFSDYRKRQSKYFSNLKALDGKYKLAIGHICPVQTTKVANSDPDIERKNYSIWSKNFERIGTQLMLCGHQHDAYFLQPNDSRSLLKHNYPVIVGSACNYEAGIEDITGTAITLKGDTAYCKFTNKDHTVSEEFEVKLS